MDSIDEGLFNQGLSSEVVGLLILNELKCFRKELTNEVKNLSRKLDSVSHYCLFKNKTSPDGVCDNDLNTSMDLPNATSGLNDVFKNFNTTSSVFSQSETFKEISPQRHNEILSNHIAFRMNEPHQTNQVIDKINSSSNNKTVVTLKRHAKTTSSPIPVQPTSVHSQFITQKTVEDVNINSNIKQIANPSSSKSKYSVIYKCTFCSVQCDTMSEYNEHFSEAHNSDFSANSMCTKSFLEDQTTRNFFDIPQPKIIYICTVCSRHFSSKGGVMRHSLLHSGVKKYVCKLCGKGFFRSDHLKSHLPTHSRRKHYQCSVCFKYFSGLSNFQNHMKLHELDTDFQSREVDQHTDTSEFLDSNPSSSVYNPPLQETSCLASTGFDDDYPVKQEALHE